VLAGARVEVPVGALRAPEGPDAPGTLSADVERSVVGELGDDGSLGAVGAGAVFVGAVTEGSLGALGAGAEGSLGVLGGVEGIGSRGADGGLGMLGAGAGGGAGTVGAGREGLGTVGVWGTEGTVGTLGVVGAEGRVGTVGVEGRLKSPWAAVSPPISATVATKAVVAAIRRVIPNLLRNRRSSVYSLETKEHDESCGEPRGDRTSGERD
jgi:hypothetical protein